VALTAFARTEDRRQAMLAGFDVHVAKPVERGELVTVVSRLARKNVSVKPTTSFFSVGRSAH
jgi:CheY-like chemotaxis protein